MTYKFSFSSSWKLNMSTPNWHIYLYEKFDSYKANFGLESRRWSTRSGRSDIAAQGEQAEH